MDGAQDISAALGLPDLGAPIVSIVVNRDHDVQVYETLKPPCPTRAVYDFTSDEDGPVYVRDLSDEEYEAALARWQEAVAEWERTNGLVSTKGPMRYDVTARLLNGSVVTLVGDGKEWAVVATTEVA